MAELLCKLHWDGKKVVKTYHVLSTGPNDKVTLITSDTKPFIIQSTDATLAGQLGLTPAPNAKGPNLYQVKKAGPDPSAEIAKMKKMATPAASRPAWLKLKCGTLDKNGQLLSWGGVGPDGY